MDRAARVLELVEGAQALPQRERSAWLKRECGADAALQDEVEELLSLEEGSENGVEALDVLPGDARTFIDRFKREIAQATRHAEARVRHQALFDRVLAELAQHGARAERYRLEEPLGRGGMGEVYAAWDQFLRRRVAYKRVRGQQNEAPAPGIQIRFLQEAQVTGQLDHPGVPTVHEIGVEDGRLFFTMPLVQGMSLAELLADLPKGVGAWEHRRALDILLQAARAIAHAHERGVVHRDLKPANLMIGRFGAAYVMDWGIARVVDEQLARELLFGSEVDERIASHLSDAASGDRAFETAAGGPLGTPSYMSPEQARAGAIGPATDVYALGAILYEVLAGRPPYMDRPGEDGGPPSATEVTRRVLEGPPTPLARTGPTAPPELVAIAERAMRRDPGQRFASVLGFVEDLENYLAGRVVRSYETGPVAGLRKWVGRNRLLAVVALVAVVAAVGGTVGVLFVQSRREAEARDQIAQIMKLSSMQDTERLTRELKLLWPPSGDRLGDLRGWQEEALRLSSTLSDFRSELEEIERRVPLGADGERRFATSQEEWWHHQLTVTTETLTAFIDPIEGPVFGTSRENGPGVSQRIAWAEDSLARAMDPALRAAWARVRADVAADPAFGGLRLATDVDLLPLRKDPESGLWEFVFLPSGDPPAAGEDGRWIVERGTGVVLILLPGDRHWMGSQRLDPAAPNFASHAPVKEQPVHEVELAPFLLSRFELTRGQWVRLAGFDTGTYADPAGTLPVDSMSWWEAHEVLAHFELLLPTEAQWELAARGGSEGPFWWGDVGEDLPAHDLTTFRRNPEWLTVRYTQKYGEVPPVPHVPRAVDVGTPNPFGFVNVNGNLSEWTRDRPTSYEQPVEGPDALRVANEAQLDRVVRGGSLRTTYYFSRVSRRDYRPGDVRAMDCGIRPARAVRAD